MTVAPRHTAAAPPRSSAPAVEVHGLRKRFGSVQALDGLDLVVAPGQVAGFLGPNGAGKSTTIRVLLGMLRPDAGTARLLGGDPWSDAVALHRRLAYVPGDVTLWPHLTGGETIDLLLRLRGAPVDPQRRQAALDRFELDPTRRTGTYSKGNRQKVALVAAFAADVELLVLDEPTSGLDPIMEAVFQDCVRDATSRGASVLLSSHILAEVETLCDTVTIIRAGRTVQAGTLAELRHLTRSAVVAHVPDAPRAVDALGRVDGVHDLAADDDRVTFHLDDAAVPGVVRVLADLDAHGLTIAPPSLEELFLREYGDELAALEGSGEDGAA
ncbi:ABC transporter ATP-binding protein [Luteimicrobium subarcticum]|uniref:ABC-2 type transport system ATP-binding protein n=1 Tax=Luteimicrobium subarcticum TaxID=620910 RepID=A0A2M8W6J4_9MICO|nr:ABC transporter ATP-binding protein [Luteimicrobium subarcticum]PJI86551.1 ABC-2 type transport system ATP-binding protein [Luteimicrobium subarcticum]